MSKKATLIRKIEITELQESGNQWIHLDGCFDDHTLCGEDTSGDNDREIKRVAIGKIDCPRCLIIIKYCKRINFRDLKSG